MSTAMSNAYAEALARDQGMPESGDHKTDAWQLWYRMRSNITDRNRKNPGTCPQLNAAGAEGWLWKGHLRTPREFVFGAGNPKDHPYNAVSSDKEAREEADRNFEPVRKYVTQQTGNLACMEIRRAEPSTWWVRDTFSGVPISETAYKELRRALMVAGGFAEEEKAGTPVEPAARPATVPVFSHPDLPQQAAEPAAAQDAAGGGTQAPRYGNPASHSEVPDELTCRYRDAAGCTYVSKGSPQPSGRMAVLYNHEEIGRAHEGHRVPLLDCPSFLCGRRIGSRNGRAQHLSFTHGLTAGSPARLEADARQTRELWDAARGAPAAPAAPPAEPIDDDVAAVLRQYEADTGQGHAEPGPGLRQRAADEALAREADDLGEPIAQTLAREAAEAEAAADVVVPSPAEAPFAGKTPPPGTFAEDPRIAGLRALLADYDQLKARAADAEARAAKAERDAADAKARQDLIREALGL
jgi:hypothetical protein